MFGPPWTYVAEREPDLNRQMQLRLFKFTEQVRTIHQDS